MATSRLQKYTKNKLIAFLGEYEILENYRPLWMKSSTGYNLELDFYLPKLDVAIEVQGEQHYKYVPLFHGDLIGFYNQIKRDREKADLASSMGVILFEVASRPDVDSCISSMVHISLGNMSDYHMAKQYMIRHFSIKRQYNSFISIYNQKKETIRSVSETVDILSKRASSYDRDKANIVLNGLLLDIKPYDMMYKYLSDVLVSDREKLRCISEEFLTRFYIETGIK